MRACKTKLKLNLWCFVLFSLFLFILTLFFCFLFHTLDLPIIRWPTFYGHGYCKSMISVWAIWNGSFVFLLLLMYFVCCFHGQYYITMVDDVTATTATAATDDVSNITCIAPTGIQLIHTLTSYEMCGII